MHHSLPPSDDIIAMALAEDLGVPMERILRPASGDPALLAQDVTSDATVSDRAFSGVVRARQAGVICGLPVAARVFELLGAAAGVEVECFPLLAEGADIKPGEDVLEIGGSARAVLAGERTMLNLLMLLSGIASEARRWQQAAPGIVVTDTRKTLPGLRALSKYAVRVGGAHNHRAGLHDMVLIKDNHIAAAGTVSQAVRMARAAHPDLLIECEADSIPQAVEATRAGADYVLLDNMDDAVLAEAVRAVCQAAEGRTVLTEASGNITFERLASLAGTGVDRVSTSALTLARPLDLGLDAT